MGYRRRKVGKNWIFLHTIKELPSVCPKVKKIKIKELFNFVLF